MSRHTGVYVETGFFWKRLKTEERNLKTAQNITDTTKWREEEEEEKM